MMQITNLVRKTFSPTPGPGSPWPLFWFSLKNIILSRKKTPFLLLFLLIPLVITLFVASSLDTYTPDNDQGVTSARGGRAWFQDILNQVFFPLLIPIVTAVYASGAIGEEVEGKTLPYLFTRPVFRSWILLAKTLAFLLAASILGIVALTITYFVAVGITENPFDKLHELFGYWGAVALVVTATGGVFLAFCALVPRGGVVGITIYLFVWETILSGVLPSNIQKYSFAFYERSYINSFIDRQAGFISELLVDQPSATEAFLSLFIAGFVGFLGALLIVSLRDYNV
jgi:ABC-2 type transport system permease protein